MWLQWTMKSNAWNCLYHLVYIYLYLVDSLHLRHEFHSDYMDYGLTKWNFYNIHFWKIGWVFAVSLFLSSFCIRMLVFVHESISIRMSMLVSIRLPLPIRALYLCLWTTHIHRKKECLCLCYYFLMCICVYVCNSLWLHKLFIRWILHWFLHAEVSNKFYWMTIYLCAVWLTNDEINFQSQATQKFNFQNEHWDSAFFFRFVELLWYQIFGAWRRMHNFFCLIAIVFYCKVPK